MITDDQLWGSHCLVKSSSISNAKVFLPFSCWALLVGPSAGGEPACAFCDPRVHWGRSGVFETVKPQGCRLCGSLLVDSMTCLSVANAIGLNGVRSEYFLVPDWYFRLHQSTEWHALLFKARSDSALPIQMWRGFVLQRELSAV